MKAQFGGNYGCRAMFGFFRFSMLLLYIIFFVSCTSPAPVSTPALVLTSTPVPTQSPGPLATSTPVVIVKDSGWVFIQPGMEQRQINIHSDGAPLDEYVMVRIDPVYYRFEIHYDQVSPKKLQVWAAETNAQVVVNGGYFKIENGQYLPTGLFIVNGQEYGETFGDFAGMFTVSADVARLRWLHDEPFLNEQVQFALQSFPVLVKPGGVIGFSAEDEDNIRARRTVIAQDKDGRFILFASAYVQFTLHQLSKYLALSDLDLDIALNLDGGPSTGLYISASGAGIPSTSDLPIVITVHTR